MTPSSHLGFLHAGAEYRIGGLAVLDQQLADLDGLVDRDGEAQPNAARLPSAGAQRQNAEFTPITRALESTNGPPELPGLIGASVWMALM